MTKTPLTALLTLCGTALAQPATLTIDSTLSTIDVVATAFTPVGDRTDTSMTSVTGDVQITLDDYGTPTAITINDFDFALTSNPTLNFDFGFGGSADATLTNAVTLYGTPGIPTGPVPIVADAFAFPVVPTMLMGTVAFDYTFFLVGSDSGIFDLADQGATSAPFNGTVTSDGTTVTLDATFDLDTTVEVVPGIASVQLIGTARLVATGDAPAADPACNPADVASPFGILDLSDVDTFIAGFAAADPVADLALPTGIFDLSDIDAFIAGFLAGCP